MTEHLIASTLTALAAVVAAALLRGRSAKVRFAIILAGLLRFALPTSWLTDAGETVAHRVPAYIDTGVTGWIPLPALPPVGSIALAVWIVVALVCLVLSARRWFPRVEEVRAAEPAERELVYRVWDRLGIRQRVGVRIVAPDQVPAACGVFRPFIALPEGLTAALTPAELDAVLSHELAHIARRDNLWAAVVRTVVSVFWFHPLVWWIEHRLLAERETACDEFVLAHGATRQDYVTGIAKVCRIAFAGPPSFARITGANLKTRAAHILTVDLRRVFSGRASLATVAFMLAALLAPMSAGFLAAQPPVLQQIQIAVAKGKVSDAIVMMEALLVRDPRNVDLCLQLAGLYMRERRYDAAIGMYEQLAYDQPSSGDLLFRLAEANRRAGKLQKALELFERAAALVDDPFRPDALLQQALLLDGTGRHDQARPVYEKVLEVKPNQPVAANNLAYLLVEEGGDLDRALTLALAAHEQLPDSADIADTLGWVYLKNGMTEEALAAFHNALEDNIDSAARRSHMLEALDRVGNPTPEMQELRVLLRAPVTSRTDVRISGLLRTLPRLN